MKTYLLDSFNKYKRFSQSLDAQTVLCNKSWQVFNDSGEKETYIFKGDGSIIISVSGAVTFGKWSYEPANQSIILTGNNKSYMVKPAFLDDNILALQVDGTNNYFFLIDEVKKDAFLARTYTELIQYFEEKSDVTTEPRIQNNTNGKPDSQDEFIACFIMGLLFVIFLVALSISIAQS